MAKVGSSPHPGIILLCSEPLPPNGDSSPLQWDHYYYKIGAGPTAPATRPSPKSTPISTGKWRVPTRNGRNRRCMFHAIPSNNARLAAHGPRSCAAVPTSLVARPGFKSASRSWRPGRRRERRHTRPRMETL